MIDLLHSHFPTKYQPPVLDYFVSSDSTVGVRETPSPTLRLIWIKRFEFRHFSNRFDASCYQIRKHDIFQCKNETHNLYFSHDHWNLKPRMNRSTPRHEIFFWKELLLLLYGTYSCTVWKITYNAVFIHVIMNGLVVIYKQTEVSLWYRTKKEKIRKRKISKKRMKLSPRNEISI